MNSAVVKAIRMRALAMDMRTDADIARKCEMTPQMLYMVLHGKSRGLPSRVKLANVLGLSLDLVIGERLDLIPEALGDSTCPAQPAETETPMTTGSDASTSSRA